MAEYIDRKEATNYIKNSDLSNREKIACLCTINAIPAADVAPVRHGKWVDKGYVCGETAWECSECHEIEWRTSCSRLNYCPFCGAKMDLEE